MGSLRAVCDANTERQHLVAIYHLSVKTISRSAGRTATAAAAYRAGVAITDLRTGEVHDYTRKRGIASTDLVLPAGAPDWASDRAALWNAAEQAETRKNSTVAREFEIALPAELPAAARRQLAVDFARELAERHGCAVDVSVHEPGKEGDNRNHHAHVLCSTRRLTPAGFGEKTRELDDRKTKEVDRWRERFAVLQNERLQQHGIAARVDHRTLKEQGIDREPTQHFGPQITAMVRKGKSSHVKQRIDDEVTERLRAAAEQGRLDRERAATEQSILVLSADIAAAKKQRLQEKMAVFEARADERLAQLQAAEVAAAKLRLQQERESILQEIAAARAVKEMKQKEAAELARVQAERAHLVMMRRQQERRQDRDDDYDMPGP